MSLNAEAYTRHLQQLLPPGVAWTRDPEALLTQLLRALADELARVDGSIHRLMDEADPRTTGQLLGDWEDTAGLPDPCVTEPQSTEERRKSLRGRLTATGGASAVYFVAIAEGLGYVDPFVDEPQVHVWRMNLHEDTNVTAFRAGQSTAGEALRTWGNESLECLLERLKPAHTRVLFAYGVA